MRHLGTQYIASLVDGALQVAVREGSVAIERGRRRWSRVPAKSLAVRGDGSVTRTRVDLHGEAWRWAAASRPEFAIEGRSLDEFLAWAGAGDGPQDRLHLG